MCMESPELVQEDGVAEVVNVTYRINYFGEVYDIDMHYEKDIYIGLRKHGNNEWGISYLNRDGIDIVDVVLRVHPTISKSTIKVTSTINFDINNFLDVIEEMLKEGVVKDEKEWQ